MNAEYEKIWKLMAPCVQQCIIDDYRGVEEMLCCKNAYTLHVRCRCIIERVMKALEINDPHVIDKVMYWKVVKEGWDRDPKFRCICAFFFAAAMELDVVDRLKKQDGDRKIDKFDNSGKSVSDLHKQLLDLIQKMQQQHAETHEKVHEIHNRLVEPGKVRTVHVIHSNTVNSPSTGLDDVLRKVLEMSREAPSAPETGGNGTW